MNGSRKGSRAWAASNNQPLRTCIQALRYGAQENLSRQSGWPRPAWQGDDSRAATRRDWRLAPLGSAMKMRHARASCLLEPLVILARGALLLE